MVKKDTTRNLSKDEGTELVAISAPIEDGDSKVPNTNESVVFKPPADVSELPSDSKPPIGAPMVTLSSLVNSFVGLPLPEVRSKLEELKLQRRIKDYKILPMGVPLASTVISGRVQVIKDHNDNVLDIVLG